MLKKSFSLVLLVALIGTVVSLGAQEPPQSAASPLTAAGNDTSIDGSHIRPGDSVGGGPTHQGLLQESGVGNDEAPPANVTLDPSSWDFGQVAVDFAYNKVFTLTNSTDHSITLTGIFAEPAPRFSVIGTTCHITLPGHGSQCSITVQIDAESGGLKSGNLTVDCSGGDGCPFTSTLTATAVHDVTLSKSSCYLLSQGIGIPSPSCAITFMNNEPVRLAVTSIETGSPFSETNNCVPSVAANSSCTINVVYTPEEYGIVNGTLSITDNSRDGTPPSVSLTGEIICILHCEEQ